MKASGATSIMPVCMPRSTMRGIHEIIQRVVDRPQIGIDLVAHVAGQEAEPLAGLDRRARQDQPLDRALLQQRDGVADREPGLAGARRTFGEHQFVALERAQIVVLRRDCGRAPARACGCRSARTRRARVGLGVGKQALLPRAFLDGAVDVAKAQSVWPSATRA